MNTASVIRSSQLTGYRALWTYLAAAWLAEEAEERRDEALKHAALDLLRKAHAAGRSTSWLRQVQPLPQGERALDELDHAAVRRAAEHGPGRMNNMKWAARHTELLEGLNQPEARRYEGALVELGMLLGGESYKPPGDPGRSDTAWVWPYLWLAIEAKTEERGDVAVSQATVRQANDQLKCPPDRPTKCLSTAAEN